jgi:predicted GNAT family acetyltransferase
MANGEYVVRDNPEQRRYEILRAGERLGEIRYRLDAGTITLLHTEVVPTAEGQGIGSRLVAGALDDIRARGLRLVPVCPFVRAYLRRHPNERDLTRA